MYLGRHSLLEAFSVAEALLTTSVKSVQCLITCDISFSLILGTYIVYYSCLYPQNLWKLIFEACVLGQIPVQKLRVIRETGRHRLQFHGVISKKNPKSA